MNFLCFSTSRWLVDKYHKNTYKNTHYLVLFFFLILFLDILCNKLTRSFLFGMVRALGTLIIVSPAGLMWGWQRRESTRLNQLGKSWPKKAINLTQFSLPTWNDQLSHSIWWLRRWTSIMLKFARVGDWTKDITGKYIILIVFIAPCKDWTRQKLLLSMGNSRHSYGEEATTSHLLIWRKQWVLPGQWL